MASLPQPQIKFLPTIKQHQAWLLLTNPHSIIEQLVFGGGAGGGKTTFACCWLVIMAMQYPGIRSLIGRKELKRLKQSVLLTLFDILGEWKFMPGLHYNYNSQESKITFYNPKQEYFDERFKGGSEFHFYDLDLMPSDPRYERLGSIEYTNGFIEEAAEVESKAVEVVTTRLRYKLDEYGLRPRLLMTCNPSKNYLYYEYYQPWKNKTLEPTKAFIQALAVDNPHISPHYVESLKRVKDRVLRERLLYGNWEYEDDDMALFTYDDLLELFHTQDKPIVDGKQYLICDAARMGKDKAVIFRFVGLRVVEYWVFAKCTTVELENKLRQEAAKHAIPMSQVLVDEDGVGGGIVDHLQCKGFVGNATPFEHKKDSEMRHTEYKVNYQNQRTQCYYLLSEKVSTHEILVECDDASMRDGMIQELEQIKARDIDKDTKLRIVSKDDIKAVISRSPDFADTLMMRMYFEAHREKSKAKTHSSLPW